MRLFDEKKFIILPNNNSSTLKFFSKLLSDNGGSLLENHGHIEKQPIILVNDTFIDSNGTIADPELFRKELDFDANELWDLIQQSKPVSVRASCISEWLKLGTMDISADHSRVSLERIDFLDDPFIIDNERLAAREISSKESGQGSESDTDIGSYDELAKFEKPMNKLESSGRSAEKLVDEGRPSNNEVLIRALGRLAKRFEVKGDRYRSRGYKLAKIGIEKYPFEILSGEQASREITSVGSSIARKIQIILDTGGLPGLEESFESERRLNYFTQCHDVGVYSARRWNLLGLTTFSEVSRKFPDLFVRDWTVLFGWSYYDDWLKRITRAECEEVLRVVKDQLKQIDPEFEVELQGSYVRGKPECGDIDLLFFKKGLNDTFEIGRVLERLSLDLYAKGYVQCFLQLTTRIKSVFESKIEERITKCGLKVPSDSDYPPVADGLKKFYLGFKLRNEFNAEFLNVTNDGFSRLDPADKFMSMSSSSRPCRRVDFFCCRWSELGAARLQWTGPKEFNRWIRIQAAQKGMKLTQHGLYKGEIALLESFDERRIFDILGLEYLGPQERSRIMRKKHKVE